MCSQLTQDRLIQFFVDIHPVIPLFGRDKFLQLFESNLINQDLILTIITITARVTGQTSVEGIPDINACLQHLLDSVAIGDSSSIDSPSLDLFRKECLLAYFSFHQTPGQHSWALIGRLTRKAYLLGLHQLENPDNCPILGEVVFSPEEIEEWRALWWCLFCLDVYSNLAAGTPFGVEFETINTALPRYSLDEVAAGQMKRSSKMLMSSDIEHLWTVLPEIIASPSVLEFNLHVISTVLLRQLGVMLRIQMLRPGEPIEYRRETLDRALTKVIQALPPNYLLSARISRHTEPTPADFIRFNNVLHFYMGRITCSVPGRLDGHEAEWERLWRDTVDSSEGIVAVIAQWELRFLSRVDPATCFITYLAMEMLTLQHRCVSSSPSMRGRLAQEVEVLKGFLQSIATIWAMPEHLLQQHEERIQSLPASITYEDIDRILKSFKAPLYPKLMKQFPPGLPLWGIDRSTDFQDLLEGWDMEMVT